MVKNEHQGSLGFLSAGNLYHIGTVPDVVICFQLISDNWNALDRTIKRAAGELWFNIIGLIDLEELERLSDWVKCKSLSSEHERFAEALTKAVESARHAEAYYRDKRHLEIAAGKRLFPQPTIKLVCDAEGCFRDLVPLFGERSKEVPNWAHHGIYIDAIGALGAELSRD